MVLIEVVERIPRNGLLRRRGIYHLYWWERGRRCWLSTGTREKRLAELWQRSWLEERLIASIRGREISGSGKPISLGEMYQRYAEVCLPQKAATTQVDERGRWPRILKRIGAALPLTGVTRAVLERYRAERLREGVGPRTVNLEIGMVLTLLRRAVEWGEMAAGDLPVLRKLREKRRDRPPLAPADVVRLVEAAGEHHPTLGAAVEFAALTGCRRSEVFNLCWRDVDLTAGRVVIRNPKNKRDRALAMSGRLRDLLMQVGTDRSLEFVFPSPRTGGRVVNFDRALRETGNGLGIRPLGWHDLRRFFARTVASMGTSPFALKALMGHREISTTERYVEPYETEKVSALEKVAQVIRENVLIWPGRRAQSGAKRK